VTQADVQQLYAARLVLVRPDGYVAWRADIFPEGDSALATLLATVCGEAGSRILSRERAPAN
jgi:hypothetical protein